MIYFNYTYGMKMLVKHFFSQVIIPESSFYCTLFRLFSSLIDNIRLVFLFFDLKKKQDEKHVLILQRTETTDQYIYIKKKNSIRQCVCVQVYKNVSLCDNKNIMISFLS
jgi:hypothetical protein